MTGNTRVVVVGGGYAGVMAANRLTRRGDVTVTLINSRPAFVERIRLHQMVAGNYDASADYARLLAKGVDLVVDTVTGIDAGDRVVTLAGGGTARYDYLIYAVGSVGAAPGVPGAAEFAYSLDTLEEARRLRQVIDATPATAPVTVVGAGLTGIETAAELAETGRPVTLVCGDVLAPSLHPRGRRAVAERLARLGVTVLEGPGATVTAVTGDAVRLGDGRRLASRVTVWAAGLGVPDLARRSGLSTDATGRLRTDETLTSLDDPRIVAAGDAAAPSDLPYRMSCAAAIQMGPQAAETVLARIEGRHPRPVEVGFLGQCLSLGRSAGMIQFSRRNDTVTRHHLGGRTGARIKEAICRGTIWLLSNEARRPGARDLWARDRTRRRLVADRRGEPALTR
jgi:NADH dehydrogenase, FAD-containing subunit